MKNRGQTFPDLSSISISDCDTLTIQQDGQEVVAYYQQVTARGEKGVPIIVRAPSQTLLLETLRIVVRRYK